MSLLQIALAIWALSFAVLFWRTSLTGVARLLHSIFAFPLLGILAVCSVILVNSLVPDAHQVLVWVKESQHFSHAEFAVAWAIYGTIPAALFWAWLSLLRKLGGARISQG